MTVRRERPSRTSIWQVILHADAVRKCVKSAVFGDADNLWEVLWYANSGVSGGDYASLYLSCVVSGSILFELQA